MITPAGAPAWTRTATPDIYGAVPGLHDLGGVGAVNAKTDITAAEYARMAADVASAVRAAPLFWLTFRVTTSPSKRATVLQCSPMWDVPSGEYAGESPPAGSYPKVHMSGTYAQITFPDLVTTIDSVKYLRAPDDFGVYGNCRVVNVVVSSSGALDVIGASIVDGVEIDVSDFGDLVNGSVVHVVAR